MRYLVTGSSGYIGSRLARRLLDTGHEVVGIDREPTPIDDLDLFIESDILDPGALDDVFEGVDQVLHLAAAKGDWGISEREYFRDNLAVTERLVEASIEAGVKDWVFYSTVSTLGPGDTPIPEEAPFNPIDPYGESKAEAEKVLRDWEAEDPDVQILIIRPSVVFGPGNPSSTNVYRLIDAIYNRRFLMVGPGEAIKTTSYIENLLEATLFLMEKERSSIETFTYVDTPRMTTGDMVNEIYSLLERSAPSWHAPLPLVRPLAYVADVVADLTGIDLPITAARIEKFNRATNFESERIREAGFSQPVSNEQAFLRTVDWHLRTVYDEPNGVAHSE